MAALKFDITADNANMLKSLREVQGEVRNTTSAIERSGESIEGMFSKVKMAATSVFAGVGIQEFVNQMISVRGEFQKTEIAFRTMLGSQEKADRLMNQLIQTAAITPFGVSDITEAAKQLLAYNTAAEDVNETITRLGDIAAGMGMGIKDLVFLYGTTVAKGKMDTMDLRQLLNRGIPIADEIAKIMGLDVNNAIAAVSEQVSKGAVTADIFSEALMNLAGEGSKFGGLMEAQSASIPGRISNIQDAIEQMFNKFGQKSEGFVYTALDGISLLVENWQTVGQAIISAVTALGTYKASVVALAAAQKAQQKAYANEMTKGIDDEIKTLNKLRDEAKKQLYSSFGGEEAYKKDRTKQIGDALADTSVSKEKMALLTEQLRLEGFIDEKLEAQLLKRKEDLLLTVEETRQMQLAAEQEKLNAVRSKIAESDPVYGEKQQIYDEIIARKELAEQIIEENNARLDSLRVAAQSDDAAEAQAAVERIVAIEKENAAAANEIETMTEEANTLATEMNTIANKNQTYGTEHQTLVNNVNTLSVKGNTLAEGQNTVATTSLTLAQRLHNIATKASTITMNLFTGALNAVKNSFQALKIAFATNPFGLIITAVTTLLTLLPMFSDEMDEVKEASTKFGESAQETLEKVEELIAILRMTKSGSKVHKDAMKELSKLAEDYGVTLDAENASMKEVNDIRERLIELIKLEAIERDKANAVDTVVERYKEEAKSLYEELSKELNEELGKGLGEGVAQALRNNIDDETLQRLTGLNDLIREYAADVDKASPGTKQYTEAQKNYANACRDAENALKDILNKQKEFLRSMGVSEDKIEDVDGAITEYIKGLRDAKDEQNESNRVIAEGARLKESQALATANATGEEVRLAEQTRLSKMSMSDLYSEIDRLVSTYNGMQVDIYTKVHVDADNLPGWLTNMSDTDLKNWSTNWASIYQQLESSGANGIWVGGGPGTKKVWVTKQDVVKRMAMGSAEGRKRNKKTATPPKATVTGTKTTKPSPKSSGSRTGSKGGSSSKGGGSSESAEEKEARLKQAQQDFDEEIQSINEERENALREIDERLKSLDVELENDAFEKVRRKRLADNQKEINELNEERDEAIKTEKERQKTKFNAEEDLKKEKDKKYVKQVWDDAKLVYDTIDKIDEKYNELIEKTKQRQGLELTSEQIESMRAYLKEYGSFQQQKFAIAEEYAKKIAEAEANSNQGEVLRLQEELRQATIKVELEAAKAGIDWNVVFGELGNVLKDQVEPTIQRLERVTQSKDFSTLSTEEKKGVYDLIANLRTQTEQWGKVSLLEIGELTNEYQDSVAKLYEAKEREISLLADYEIALAKQKAVFANPESTEEQKQAAKEAADTAKQAWGDAAANVQDLSDAVGTASARLQSASARFKSDIEKLGNAISGLNSGSLKSVYEAFSSLDKLFNGGRITEKVEQEVGKLYSKLFRSDAIDHIKEQLTDKVGSIFTGLSKEDKEKIIGTLSDKIGGLLDGESAGEIKGKIATVLGELLNNSEVKDKIQEGAEEVTNALAKGIGKGGGIIGAIISVILGLLDVLRQEGIGGVVEGLVDLILGAVDGIIKDIISGKFIEQIVGSIVEGIGNILNTVTRAIGNIVSFGALDGGITDWFKNSNAKKVAEVTEELTKSNERLTKAVEGLKEEIGGSSGWKAISSATKALEYQQQVITDTMNILKVQMGYHGAHHSNAANWNLRAEDYVSINKTLAEYALRNGLQKSVVGSLADIYTLTPEEMDYIRSNNVAMWTTMVSQGKYDKEEYWDAYADLAGSLEDITNTMKEALTQTTFNGMRDGFISSLMDMDKKASEFAEDFTEYMMKAVLNARISDLMDEELKQFYEDWAEMAKSGGKLDQDEIGILRERWRSLTEEGLRLRDEAATITGYTGENSHNGSSGGFETMSQDTADVMNGRLTSIQIGVHSINEHVTAFLSYLTGLSSAIASNNNIVSDMRLMMVSSNDYLSDISKNTKALTMFGEKLDRIVKHTENL